ncbi:MAG TPA: WD40 repeat domain-containing protein [Anaerolineales bacterium]|nr:WD40 repeat domain-containing protein [Anaerolineales bacterium]
MSDRPPRRQISHQGAESHRRSWKRLAFGLALCLAVLACSVTGAPPTATAAPTVTASPVPPTSASAPPTPTPLPPSPTPLPAVIQASSIERLAPSLSFAHGELVRSLAFSPDGTTLAAAVGDQAGTIQLYEAATGQPLGTLQGHESIVWGLAFSPDGRFLASAARDHTAKVWDWRAGSLVRSLDFPNEVTSVAFSPDSQIFAVGGVKEWPNAAIWMYQVDTWQPLLTLAEFWNIPAIAFSPDGTRVVGGGTSRNVRVWRTSDGDGLSTLYHSGQVSSLAISPDGSTVATGLCQTSANNECAVGAVWMWNLSTGRLIRKLADFPTIVEGVAFSPDGSLVVAVSRDGTLRAYDASGGRPLLAVAVPVAAEPVSVDALAFSADGRFIATGGAWRIDLWTVSP